MGSWGSPFRSAFEASCDNMSALFSAGLDGSDDLSSSGDKVAAFASCDFGTAFACRGLDTISEAARPNDPAVSKEADKTAVIGSHLFGSMINGFDRNLDHLVSIYTSKFSWKDSRCEHGRLKY